MTKLLRIERCGGCVHIQTNFDVGGHVMYSCWLYSNKRLDVARAWDSIPDWCPLPDAPAWHTVPSEDCERDDGACIEVGYGERIAERAERFRRDATYADREKLREMYALRGDEEATDDDD